MPMGPHGNGRQRMPAALNLLLGLTAALACFHDDVAVYSLRLRAGRSIRQEMKEHVDHLVKLAKKYDTEVNHFYTLKKEYAAAKGGDKKKLENRYEEWVKHCNKRRDEIRPVKKAAKSSVEDAKKSKNPDDKKEAVEAEKKVNDARQSIKKNDDLMHKFRSEPI